MVAIENRGLHAVRDNKNHWKIEKSDLDAWIDQRDTKTDTSGDTITDGSSDTATDSITHQSITVARLEAQLEASNARNHDLHEALLRERESQNARLDDLKDMHRLEVKRLEENNSRLIELLKEAQRHRGFLEWLGLKKGKP